MLYAPLSFVVVSKLTPVSTLVAVTEDAGTAAPEESLAIPVIEPRPIWPGSESASTSNRMDPAILTFIT